MHYLPDNGYNSLRHKKRAKSQVSVPQQWHCTTCEDTVNVKEVEVTPLDVALLLQQGSVDVEPRVELETSKEAQLAGPFGNTEAAAPEAQQTRENLRIENDILVRGTGRDLDPISEGKGPFTDLKLKSKKMPPITNDVNSIDIFCNLVTRDLESLVSKHSKKFNLTKPEMDSLIELERDDDIVIKESDKGGNVVLMDASEMSQRRMWVHPIVQMRQTHGHFHCLYGELRRYPAKFQAYCRLTVDMFDTILDTLRPHLQLQDTSMRQCISPEQRLLVTLRFLATGMSYGALHFDFLLGTSTICGIVRLTCDALWLHLKNQVMPQPTCEKWLQIAHGFYEVTKFPHCIGALDGKHIRVRKPPNSGSRYFNFHKFFSVVILALVDTNYKFIYVDIGAYGSASDARIFRSTRLARRMISMDLNLPTPSPLPGTSGPTVPFVMVADEGFALSPHVMRPFPRRGIDDLKSQFNSRLKTARSYVECSFGILASKWRIYQTTIQLNPTNVQSVIKATVVLHNFCRIHEENVLLDPLNSHYVANFSNVQMENTQPVLSGLQIRNNYMCYFVDH
ncbi:uncharacterized protein LOC142302391 [Anomaloglossus baeobatrachus]|uniref:uncharacterized protein LOC142302391 n=1 Tax=Anomaloglossus baeobatrachus TaxID=238106 RepID=UPI003F4F49D2